MSQTTGEDNLKQGAAVATDVNCVACPSFFSPFFVALWEGDWTICFVGRILAERIAQLVALGITPKDALDAVRQEREAEEKRQEREAEEKRQQRVQSILQDKLLSSQQCKKALAALGGPKSEQGLLSLALACSCRTIHSQSYYLLAVACSSLSFSNLESIYLYTFFLVLSEMDRYIDR